MKILRLDFNYIFYSFIIKVAKIESLNKEKISQFIVNTAALLSVHKDQPANWVVLFCLGSILSIDGGTRGLSQLHLARSTHLWRDIRLVLLCLGGSQFFWTLWVVLLCLVALQIKMLFPIRVERKKLFFENQNYRGLKICHLYWLFKCQNIFYLGWNLAFPHRHWNSKN